MALNKEYILTLTCLKEVGVSGVGTKRILSIGDKTDKTYIDSCDALFEIMSGMKEKIVRKVTLENLRNAFQYANHIIEESEAKGIRLVGYYDKLFPEILRQTINENGKSDPPLLLWYHGDLSIIQMPSIAVIGTRKPTPEGVTAGKYLSSEFAKRGFNIVSGLAVGCDSAGHKGALSVNGKTTAFLANGLDSDSIYPPENKELSEKIVANGGLLLSEYHIGNTVKPYCLVARDRLQAGLSLATLVVQTGITGGTMHAAKTTLKAGKPLYVVKFKNHATNNQEKCLGNSYLAEKCHAKYIKGDDNLDEISEKIKKLASVKTSLF